MALATQFSSAAAILLNKFTSVFSDFITQFVMGDSGEISQLSHEQYTLTVHDTTEISFSIVSLIQNKFNSVT